MTKHIMVVISDEEWEEHVTKKANRTWKDYLLRRDE